MSKIIGIDLGSTASAVAVMEGGVPTIIVNSEGNRTTPSVVSYGKDGEIKVGDAAKRQAVTNPKSTIELVKRFIGNSYSKVLAYKDKFQYDIVEGPNDTCLISINDKKITPQEVSAVILQKLKKAAEDYLGESVTDAVITVPAYFDDAQRTATKNAGEIAGLNVKRIINEPTAAALAFGVDKLNKSMKVMVVDAGGSTTDLSLMDIGDGVFEVVSTKGDMFLGGKDIDSAIVDFVIAECKKDHGVDISKDTMALQRVNEAAEKAKIELSNTVTTEINLPYLTVADGTPVHFTKTLTRAQFEKLATPFVDKIISLSKDVMKDAKMKIGDIDEVLLVGGSTRIPLVQQKIKEYFGKDGNRSINPDEAISLGAAVQGSVLSGDKQDIVLVDVTPLNLNITTMGNIASCLIEANTAIPTSKSQVFSTAADNQTSVDIEITQGNRSLSKDNRNLGRFILDGIPPAMRGVPQIEITMALDANGILNVTAKDKSTGKEQSIRIEGSSGLSKDEIQRMKDEAEANAESDKEKLERINKLNAAESLIISTEKNVADLGDKLTDEDKTAITTALDSLKAVYNVADESRDINAIEDAAKHLAEVWYPISAKVYQADSSAGTEAPNFDPSAFSGTPFEGFTPQQ